MARRRTDPTLRGIKKSSADKFGASVAAMLDAYGLEVAKNLEEITKEYAKRGAKEVKAASQQFGGHYANGWTSRFETGRYSAQGTIYNQTVPGLPHLLEHGHVTRNGTGRTFGQTPAHPHIAAAEQKISESYYENVVKNL